MIWTFNEARAIGHSVDEEALNDIMRWAFGDMKTNSVTEQPAPRDVVNLGWVYVLLSVETAPAFLEASSNRNDKHASSTLGRGATTEDALLSARQTLLQQILKKQASDGSWGRPLDERVPLGGPMEDVAILCGLALLQSGDHSKIVRDSINKAATWLAANHDKTSRQARNLRLLMKVCEASPAAALDPKVASLRAEQNADGGWSQNVGDGQ